MPIHLLIPGLRLAGAALLLPLAAAAQDGALPDGLYAEIGTPRGSITCQLDYARAPLTVASFVGLAEGTLGPKKGAAFFDGLTFHRVVPGFVIQGGDPLGTGEGGPGYQFADEFTLGVGHGAAGVLSMANDGPDTDGSQFFITLAPSERLDFLYSAFGRVVRGADVPGQIAQGDKMTVKILRVGAAARSFLADEKAFAAIAAKTPRYSGEKVPGPKSHFDDPDKLLPSDPPRAVNFNYKLNNIERYAHLHVYARLLAKLPPSDTGQTAQQYSDQLAKALGLDENGILAVYLGDANQWTLSVGSSLRNRFAVEVSGSQSTPFEAVIRRFLADSAAREVRYETEMNLVLAKNLQSPDLKLKLSTDSIIDEILAKAAG